jgi:small subunit ribosomal protein S20
LAGRSSLLVDLSGQRGYTRPLFGRIQGFSMPNIASSKKRVRTTAKRTAINTSRKTRVRGFIRKVEEAIASGDKAAALAALKAAEPEIMRGVSKGVLHKNTGSRKVSRLSKRVAKLSK